MKHVSIVSDLDEFTNFEGWAQENLSPEEFEKFLENKASAMPSAKAKLHVVYLEWVKSQKITHTTTDDDGNIFVTSYKDFE